MKQINHLIALAAGLVIAMPALAKIPVSVTLPKGAKHGESVTISVKTNPDVTCKIEAQDAGLTQTLKLTTQRADTAGKATWKFDIPRSYKANEMPVIVTVSKNSKEEKVIHAIRITQ